MSPQKRQFCDTQRWKVNWTLRVNSGYKITRRSGSISDHAITSGYLWMLQVALGAASSLGVREWISFDYDIQNYGPEQHAGVQNCKSYELNTNVVSSCNVGSTLEWLPPLLPVRIQAGRWLKMSHRVQVCLCMSVLRYMLDFWCWIIHLTLQCFTN